MASEARTRWYHRETFEIIEEVMKADKKGMTKATITHAKKFGFLPSVTSVIKGAYTQGHNLIDWMINQAILAAKDIPFTGNPLEEEQLDEYCGIVKAKSNEYRDSTADRGTQLHGYVDQWIEGKKGGHPDDPVAGALIQRLETFFRDNGVTAVHCEKAVGSAELGWAGTPDIYCETPDGPILLDMKTTKLKKGHKPYDTQKMQLGGYDILLNGDARLINFVGDRDTGESIFIEHDDPQRWRDAYHHVFETWCLTNATKPYDPRTWEG